MGNTPSHQEKLTTKFNLLPYGNHVAAPKIDISELNLTRNSDLAKVNHFFKGKFDELLEDYQKLIESYNVNELVYNSDFKITPIVGEIYYLYQRIDGSHFLSMIEPNFWDKKLIYKLKYNSNCTWDLIKE